MPCCEPVEQSPSICNPFPCVLPICCRSLPGLYLPSIPNRCRQGRGVSFVLPLFLFFIISKPTDRGSSVSLFDLGSRGWHCGIVAAWQHGIVACGSSALPSRCLSTVLSHSLEVPTQYVMGDAGGLV